MRVPDPHGPISRSVHGLLTGTSADIDAAHFNTLVAAVSSPLTDVDFQQALTCCYEMHYRGFEDVDDELEWSPGLAAAQRLMEGRFRSALHEEVPSPIPEQTRLPVQDGLRRAIAAAEDGPSLSSYLLKHASRGQFREFLVQRSMYHLKEADPHTWQIPRLVGGAKAAMVAIQSDEYGNGRLPHMHASLFAQAMRALGLDDTYGRYWDEALPETHAMVNVMSLFGLHRRWRGALVGHLAALEMTSTEPNRRYANGLRRLGLGPEATAFFDEHVEADAVHEQLAAVDMCGSLVRTEPGLHGDVLWGAACCLALDQAASAALLRRWESGAALLAAS
jgi:heme oxygenase-like protein